MALTPVGLVRQQGLQAPPHFERGVPFQRFSEVRPGALAELRQFLSGLVPDPVAFAVEVLKQARQPIRRWFTDGPQLVLEKAAGFRPRQDQAAQGAVRSGSVGARQVVPETGKGRGWNSS